MTWVLIILKEAFFLRMRNSSWRRFPRFLKPFDVTKFPGQAKGHAIYLCSDGHQFEDMMRAHWERCPESRCDHTYADHGIGLCLAPESPVAEPGESAMRIKKLIGAHHMKAEDLHESITTYQHWPCGHAVGHALPVQDQFTLLDNAKDTIRQAFKDAGMDVPSLFVGFHIDSNPLIPKEQWGLHYFDRHDYRNFLMFHQARILLAERKSRQAAV